MWTKKKIGKQGIRMEHESAGAGAGKRRGLKMKFEKARVFGWGSSMMNIGNEAVICD